VAVGSTGLGVVVGVTVGKAVSCVVGLRLSGVTSATDFGIEVGVEIAEEFKPNNWRTSGTTAKAAKHVTIATNRLIRVIFSPRVQPLTEMNLPSVSNR
jgi:hypothetical protein